MKIKKTHRSTSKNKLMLGTIVGLFVILIGAMLYYLFIKKEVDSTGIDPVNTINYSSPSEEELKETEDFKQKQQAQSDDPNFPPSNVTPIISYIGQYDAAIEASAFVSSIIEDGGTCTLLVTRNDIKISKTISARKDAQTTKCDLFMFPTNELPTKGEWSATISYKSTTSSGTSEVMKFEVK